jgi:hypothetical protein
VVVVVFDLGHYWTQQFSPPFDDHVLVVSSSTHTGAAASRRRGRPVYLPTSVT